MRTRETAIVPTFSLHAIPRRLPRCSARGEDGHLFAVIPRLSDIVLLCSSATASRGWERYHSFAAHRSRRMSSVLAMARVGALAGRCSDREPKLWTIRSLPL